MNTKLSSVSWVFLAILGTVLCGHTCDNVCKSLPFKDCRPQGQMVWMEAEKMIYTLVRCGSADAPSVSKYDPESGKMEVVNMLPLDKGEDTFFSSLLEVTKTHYFLEVLAKDVTAVRAYDRFTLTYSDVYFPDGQMDLAVDPQNRKTYVCEGAHKQILKYHAPVTDLLTPQVLYPDIQCENLILRRNSLFWYSYDKNTGYTTFFNGDIHGAYAPEVMFNFEGKVNDLFVTDTSVYFATNDDIIHADKRGNVKNAVRHGASSLVVVDDKAFLTTTDLLTYIELVDYEVCVNGACGMPNKQPKLVTPPKAYTHYLSHSEL